MQGLTFYLEYPTKADKRKATRKNPGNHSGTVCAVHSGQWVWGRGSYIKDAFCAAFDRPNSPVCTSTVTPEYLQEYCKKISEKQAREIHPELFKWLDDE